MPFFKKAQSDQPQPEVRALKLPWTKPEVIAFTIDNVMTKEECDAWIAETEEQGYEAALLNTGLGQVLAPEVRNSKRCMQGIFLAKPFQYQFGFCSDCFFWTQRVRLRGLPHLKQTSSRKVKKASFNQG